MIKRLILYLAAIFILLSSSGCAPLLVGAAVGGVGVYAVSKDTVQGDTDKSYDSLWSAAESVSRIHGTIRQEDYARGFIELHAEGGRAWIRLIRLTRAATRVRIACRKYHLPNIALAQEIFNKIIEEAR